MDALLLVLSILGAQVLIWAPILLWARRRERAATQGIREWAARSGERIVIEPEGGMYCIAPARGPGVMRNSAVVALTEWRVVVQPLFGRRSDVPLSDVVEVTSGKWFHGSYRNGRTHVILKLRDGREVALLPKDPERWLAALQAQRTREAQARLFPSREHKTPGRPEQTRESRRSAG